MKSSIQYERKFLVKELPDLTDFRKEEVEQWYLTSPNITESIRVRLYSDGRCYLDVINGFGFKREKYGRESNWNFFKDKIDIHPSIKKTRYKKSFENVLMVIDIFEDGLQLVELESYDNDFNVNNFDLPEWFGKEVTKKMIYTNNWLAYHKKDNN